MKRKIIIVLFFIICICFAYSQKLGFVLVPKLLKETHLLPHSGKSLLMDEHTISFFGPNGNVATFDTKTNKVTSLSKIKNFPNTPASVWYEVARLNNVKVLVTAFDRKKNSAFSVVYDLRRQQTIPTKNIFIPRWGYALTALSEGKALVSGGTTDQSNTVGDLEVFSLDTMRYELNKSKIKPRVYHKAIKLANGSILFVAGASELDSGIIQKANLTIENWDGKNEIKIVGSLPVGGEYASVTSFPDEQFLIMLSKFPNDISGGLFLYDFKNKEVKTLNGILPCKFNLNGERFGQAEVLLNNNISLIIGGMADAGSSPEYCDLVLAFDKENQKFRVVGRIEPGTFEAGMVANNNIYINDYSYPRIRVEHVKGGF